MRKRSRKLEEECCSSRVHKLDDKHDENVGGEDIISHLPQDILHHIFSFIDMKQSIQTCILSKRWRHFWVSIPTLKFTYMGRGKGYRTIANRNEFMDFVDRVLMIRGNSNIHEFVFVNLNDANVTDRLNTWIITSVIRKVQKLTLDTHFPEKFQLHHCLFTCKSLTKLVVENFPGRLSLSLPDSITLPSLKTLSLHSVMFEGDDEKVMDHLFSSCPVLESLIIKNCVFPHDNISIPSPPLQHLVVQYCRTRKHLLNSDSSDIKFKLCAPNLISFHYDDYMSICCDLKNLCSLVKADINVKAHCGWSKKKKAMYAPHMVNILRELHNVEDLTLSTSFLEVITGAPDLLDSQPTKFCNLKCLLLKGTWLSQGCIPAISYLLKISPNIETLLILDDWPWNAPTDLLDVQPTYFCNLRCLKMYTLLSRDWIYAIACLLKICPNTETLSYTLVYTKENCDEIMNPYCDKINSDRVIERDYWEAVLSLGCVLNHLKCFELRDVTGRINELEFLEILLKNAMVLDKLLIVFKTTYSDTSRRQVKFSEKVLTFPRASPSVVILFKFSEKVL